MSAQDDGAPRWTTAIADTSAESVRIRGYDISDLAENYDFGAVFYLIACGELPTPNQAKIFNAMMVEAVERGITPSSAIARIVASCGAPLQAAVAAGILSFGDKHGGVGIEMAAGLQRAMADHDPSSGGAEPAMAESFVRHYLDQGMRVPGFGQPLHPQGDPRAVRLMHFADELRVTGTACAVARAAQDVLAAAVGRTIALNVDGAIACIAVDIGFPGELIRGVNFVARAAGLCAHAAEESATSRSFRVPAEESEVRYAGPAARDLAAPTVSDHD